jgi:glycosyltransferase involved in cell wall biosynthesis
METSFVRLDVIIPTYNRCGLLAKALRSLSAARVPAGMDVRVTVVDNNSKDETRGVVEEQKETFDGRLGYVFEAKQGRSHALNTGIGLTTGDLIGLIDDDEEVDAGWFETIYETFGKEDVDFIGGPYIPVWGAEPPPWLPATYVGVIGWVDGGEEVVPFGDAYPGILMGGNAVLTRSIVSEIGLYSTALGRTDKHLLSCEDRDLYMRLIASGAKGFYIPDLKIYHYIPPERLTKKYFRRWCFWQAVSMTTIDATYPVSKVYVLGVPRWFYGLAARRFFGSARELLRRPRSSPQVFSAELAVWEIAGFFYGKHFYRPQQQSAMA